MCEAIFTDGLRQVKHAAAPSAEASRPYPASTTISVMKPAKPSATAKPQRTAKAPSHKAIIRAVASSTAIETGKSVREIERSLLGKASKLRKVAPAN